MGWDVSCFQPGRHWVDGSSSESSSGQFTVLPVSLCIHPSITGHLRAEAGAAAAGGSHAVGTILRMASPAGRRTRAARPEPTPNSHQPITNLLADRPSASGRGRRRNPTKNTSILSCPAGPPCNACPARLGSPNNRICMGHVPPPLPLHTTACERPGPSRILPFRSCRAALCTYVFGSCRAGRG